MSALRVVSGLKDVPVMELEQRIVALLLSLLADWNTSWPVCIIVAGDGGRIVSRYTPSANTIVVPLPFSGARVMAFAMVFTAVAEERPLLVSDPDGLT